MDVKNSSGKRGVRGKVKRVIELRWKLKAVVENVESEAKSKE